ncbi:hypothetical protein ACFPRL_22165 [Pseudoclavibacter helvolus]
MVRDDVVELARDADAVETDRLLLHETPLVCKSRRVLLELSGALLERCPLLRTPVVGVAEPKRADEVEDVDEQRVGAEDARDPVLTVAAVREREDERRPRERVDDCPNDHANRDGDAEQRHHDPLIAPGPRREDQQEVADLRDDRVEVRERVCRDERDCAEHEHPQREAATQRDGDAVHCRHQEHAHEGHGRVVVVEDGANLGRICALAQLEHSPVREGHEGNRDKRHDNIGAEGSTRWARSLPVDRVLGVDALEPLPEFAATR